MTEYSTYAEWKGWLGNTRFGTLTSLQELQYQNQLEKLGIPYTNINALEIGYGNGGFLTFLIKNNSKVSGVEIQKPLLIAAEEFGISAKNSIEDIEGAFDLIAAFDVLEHLSIVQLNSFFKKSSSLLKSNGLMLFRFPNAESFAGLGAQNGDCTHITAIAQSKLDQLIQPFGLKIIKFEGEATYPKKIIINCIRGIFRYLLMKGMGIGNKHFFSTNVVAVIAHK